MGRSELDLATEAIANACADAGLPITAVDGFVSYHVEQVAEVDLVTALGLPELRFMARTPSGGGGAASILGLAAVAVASRNRRRARSQPGRATVGEGGREPARLPAVAAPVRCRGARARVRPDRPSAYARVRNARRALRRAGGRTTVPREPQSGVARSRPVSASQPHPRPDPQDADDARFWAALADGELRIQRCTACAAFRHPPRPVCAQCGSRESEWVAVNRKR